MTTKHEPLDARYFYWLYQQIGSERNPNPARSYWQLAELMFRKPFTWFVHNDENRFADGLELREVFLSEMRIAERDRLFMDIDCSVLEMLIALGNRMAFEAEGVAGDWFWRIMDNLNFRMYNDENWDKQVAHIVEGVIDDIVNRTYHPSGAGGLFPLQKPNGDQRKIEIWYQMSAFLLENSTIGDD